MSEKFTETTTPHGGAGDWGHVPPPAAIASLRRRYEHELATARGVLDDLDAGRVEVFHQYGPWAASKRRRVWPAETTPTIVTTCGPCQLTDCATCPRLPRDDVCCCCNIDRRNGDEDGWQRRTLGGGE